MHSAHFSRLVRLPPDTCCWAPPKPFPPLAEILAHPGAKNMEEKMTRRITATIEDRVYASLKEEATRSGTSPNKLMTRLLNERYHETNISSAATQEIDDSEEKYSPCRRNYTLNKEHATLLHRKAKELGITDTAYLRMMIRSKDFKRIEYSVNDLEAYIDQSQKLIDSVVRFVNFIGSAGKGEVFEPDIRKILSLLEEIKSLHKEQIRLTYSNRQKVYRKMIKRIEDEL